MKYLLDTHVMVWALDSPERLPKSARDRIDDSPDDVYVSAVSLWEAAIKQSLGKMKLPGPAAQWLPYALAQSGFPVLDITGRHALTAGTLPLIHRDPFGRMLVAQAVVESMIVVTRDRAIREYGVNTIDA